MTTNTVADTLVCVSACQKLFGRSITDISDDLIIDANGTLNTITKTGSVDGDADVLVNLVKRNYILFIDDLRSPEDTSPYYDTFPVIIARTNDLAKEVITKLGSPNGLVIDYNLKKDTIDTFVTWLNSWLDAGNKLNPGMWYYVLTTHPTKAPQLKQAMSAIASRTK